MNNKGFLDSINIVNVKFIKEREKDQDKIKVLYKLNSTMIFSINFSSKTIKMADVSISHTKQVNFYLILLSKKIHFLLKTFLILIFI